MKKINFKKLPVPQGITGLKSGKFVECDIALQIGDSMYMSLSGIAADRLSKKIYDSEGEIELTDEEIKIITAYVNADNGLFLPIREAISLAIKNKDDGK